MGDDPILRQASGELDAAQTAQRVQQIVRSAARRLVGAQGATFVLREGDKCFYADEDAISPLWKGQRFPIEQCISGWAMLNREAAIIPDITKDSRIPQAAYAPTFVRSLAMVPIGTQTPLGAIGAYWSVVRRAGAGEIARLTALAVVTHRALARLQLPQQG